MRFLIECYEILTLPPEFDVGTFDESEQDYDVLLLWKSVLLNGFAVDG
jgi:hypothetical protein